MSRAWPARPLLPRQSFVAAGSWIEGGMIMSQAEHFEILILGSGAGGKLLAWHMAGSGRRTAMVERRWIGGSCPNIACLPSKNEIWSAEVAHLVQHAAEFGTTSSPAAVNMAAVRRRKRDMVDL